MAPDYTLTLAMIERLSRIIAYYDAEGAHRTATAVDEASAVWLAGELKSAGASALIEPFATHRVDVNEAALVVDDLRIDGVPAFDCSYTGAQGVTGTLGDVGSSSDIGVAVALPYDAAPGQQQVLKARQSGQHKAIVVVTADQLPDTGPALVNAESFSAPFGPPVLQVSNRHWPTLRQAIDDRLVVRCVASARRTDTTAANVGAEIWGRQKNLSPLVIMTPRSGWWHCASERGGGIAAFLELARHFTDNPPQRNVIFTANTGHELGHTGLDHFLERNPDLGNRAHAWIHLGANFAAKDGSLLLQYGSADTAALASELRQHHPLEVAGETAAGERPLGEARNVFDAGGDYLSILGSNPLFHHPDDRFPDAVDLTKTGKCARFLVAVADRLANDSKN